MEEVAVEVITLDLSQGFGRYPAEVVDFFRPGETDLGVARQQLGDRGGPAARRPRQEHAREEGEKIARLAVDLIEPLVRKEETQVREELEEFSGEN